MNVETRTALIAILRQLAGEIRTQTLSETTADCTDLHERFRQLGYVAGWNDRTLGIVKTILRLTEELAPTKASPFAVHRTSDDRVVSRWGTRVGALSAALQLQREGVESYVSQEIPGPGPNETTVKVDPGERQVIPVIRLGNTETVVEDGEIKTRTIGRDGKVWP